MSGTFALLALVASVAAVPQGVTKPISPSSGPPAGCSASRSGSFQITVVNVTSAAKRSLQPRQKSGILSLTLNNGILKDQADRTGYIASNYQFQFDEPPQNGAIYTSGFSVCGNGSLALGGSAIFYQCLSGEFYNLYDRDWAPQCSPIYIEAINGASQPAATQQPDGQPAVTTQVSELPDGQPNVVTQISDGQVQGPTGVPVTELPDGQPQGPKSPPAAPISQIPDGQPQAPTGTPKAPVSQIPDGQPQAPTGTPKAPVSQIPDGQPQAPTGTPKAPVSQIPDGQPQAPTGTPKVPVSQIPDGQPQAPTGTPKAPVTQIPDGQPQAPTTTTKAPVNQIGDGQVQAPSEGAAVSSPPPYYNAAADLGARQDVFGYAAVGLAGFFAML